MIEVIVHNAHHSRRVAKRGVQQMVRGVLLRERRRAASVSVVFTDDRLSRRINRTYFRHDRPTDVMSFPLEVGAIEGEVYVNLDKAARQARTYGVSLANETARLVIHGTLHLLGYDDIRANAAARMKRREDFYVGLLAGNDATGR